MTDDSPRLDDPVRRVRISPIYPIIDVDLCRLRGTDPPALAEACFRGGATILQIRQKSAGSGALLSIVRATLERAAGAGAAVIVNDRADLAKMAGADGVHVGQDDLSVRDVRRICGDQAVVGLSTHTQEQVDRALDEHVDYVAVGPIFGTATKDTGYTARGLRLVRYAADRGTPVVAIGGITLENARTVIAAGAAAVAVISDLLSSEDPEARIRRYIDVLR